MGTGMAMAMGTGTAMGTVMGVPAQGAVGLDKPLLVAIRTQGGGTLQQPRPRSHRQPQATTLLDRVQLQRPQHLYRPVPPSAYHRTKALLQMDLKMVISPTRSLDLRTIKVVIRTLEGLKETLSPVQMQLLPPCPLLLLMPEVD